MRIGIDARILSDKNYAGIGQYLYEIINRWKIKYPNNEYYLFSRKDIFLKDEFPDNWHVINEPWIIDNRKMWYIFKLPQLIKKEKIDVFWGPNFSLPRKVNGVKYVVTVHDLAIYKYKRIGELKNTILIKLFGKHDCKKAERIIAVSNATAKDVKEIFGVSDKKIDMCYNGVEDEVVLEYDETNIRNIIKKNAEYILFISTIEPRKNIERLIDGYERYRDEFKNELDKLVIAGKRGWNCDGIYSRINKSSYARDIILTGYVNIDEKRYLYKNASCFIYPSLYEGFGIPVLEAFSYGVPVITTNVSSLPEVGGNAAFYLQEGDNALKMAEMIENIKKMSSDEKDILAVKMKEQTRKFSWNKCAYETMKVIEKV